MIAARSEYPKGGMWRGPRGYLEPLVKPLRGVQENRSLPAQSCVPFQFCDPSRRLLLSFSPLGALEFHQVDAGERAPGRRSASRRSQQLSGPSPGSARPASASAAWMAVQMEAPRWPRGAGEAPGSHSRAPGGGPRTRGTNLLCTRLFLSLFWLPGFQEINSDRWDPEYCLFPFLPLSPL